MRLLLLNHEFPPLGGGAATATLRLAQQFAAAGHRVQVVTAGQAPPDPSTAPPDPSTAPPDSVTSTHRLEVVRLPTCRRSALAPSVWELASFCGQAAWRLTHQARRFQADGILAFFAIPAGVLAVHAAARLDIPCIVSLRGSDVPGFAGGRLQGLGWGSRPFVRHTLARASLIAPNCEHLRQLAVRFMPQVEGKMRVVPNGIDRHQLARHPASSHSSTLRFIAVGQLIARKRVEWLIESIARLRPADVQLTLVGEGPRRRKLETLARRLGVEDRVVFAGLQPRDEVRRLLRKHDVYVSASRAEGMSNACLEAMAAGLPVVTTANGSHDLVLAAGCGEVVDCDDGEAFATALRQFHDVAERQRRGRAALDYASRLTWQASAAVLARSFQELIAARQPAPRAFSRDEAAGWDALGVERPAWTTGQASAGHRRASSGGARRFGRS